ncbi:uncharacterized protein [Dysidea avara]|uniref:uncharacterized protein n=1 Tax=Dysidea avara TaxID=196820 RepID=UPI0033246952
MHMDWLENESNRTNWTSDRPGISLTDPKRCLQYHVVSSCTRISVMFSIAVITMIACILRAIQSHCYRSANYHHYMVYYSTCVLACLLAINWIVVDTVIIDIIATFLLAIELLIVCNFYGFLAARILSQERLFKFVVIPSVTLIFLYFVGLLLWACIKQKNEFNECTAPHWIQFSSSQLVLTQLFLLSSCYITRKLNTVLTTATNRLIKKLQLWGLVMVFEISSITSFVYDLVLELTHGSHSNCDKPFTSDEVAAIFVYVIHRVVKYFLPLWVMLIVFSPSPRRPASHDGTDDSSSFYPETNRAKGNFLTINNDNESDRLLQDITTTTTTTTTSTSYQAMNGRVTT